MRKKVAVITMGVALNNEKGYTRFKFLSEYLVNHGFQVDLITTAFQHWEKKQRDLEKIDKDKYPFGLYFVYEPGYKRNIDLRRIRSHRIAAKNMAIFLNDHTDYDIIYSEIPPNDVAKAIAMHCESRHIPYIADVNDLWPEAMRMVLDVPIISDILFHPLLRDAEIVYSKVSGIIGTSDEYRDRPIKNNNRRIPRETVYVGNEIEVFDEGARLNQNKIVKDDDEFWVTYAGTLGKSYDIKTLISAIKQISDEGNKHIKAIILGGGPDEQMLKEYATSINANVVFAGYQPYQIMAAYLAKSDVVINSFVKKAPQSIVTKIGDYLASGKPMINTCSSKEFRQKVKSDNFGVNIEAEDPEILKDAILYLYKNPDKAKELGHNARFIAETQFDRKESYKKIVQMIRMLLGDEQ